MSSHEVPEGDEIDVGQLFFDPISISIERASQSSESGSRDWSPLQAHKGRKRESEETLAVSLYKPLNEWAWIL